MAPEMMHIGRINADSNDLEFFREAVMVESGCSCRLNPEPVDVIGQSLGINFYDRTSNKLTVVNFVYRSPGH